MSSYSQQWISFEEDTIYTIPSGGGSVEGFYSTDTVLFVGGGFIMEELKF